MPGVWEESLTLESLVRIPHSLMEQMLEHAQSTPDTEVCGLLGGREGLPTNLYPIPNIADNPKIAFLMEPKSQIQAMREMRERGEHLCGIYHSHPKAPAQPSDLDLKLAAYPGVPYFIISLARPSKPEIRAYYFDGKQFNKAELWVQ